MIYFHPYPMHTTYQYSKRLVGGDILFFETHDGTWMFNVMDVPWMFNVMDVPNGTSVKDIWMSRSAAVPANWILA